MNISEEHKLEFCVEFITYVKDLTSSMEYSFFTPDLIPNLASKIYQKNEEMVKQGCPSFAFTISYDTEHQRIKFNFDGVNVEDDKFIVLEKWLTPESFTKLHESIY